MGFELNTTDIKNFVEKKGVYTYYRSKNVFVLPLPTRKPERAKFENGFASIIGATMRVLDNEVAESVQDSNTVDHIISNGKFMDEEAKQVFRLFIEEELKIIEKSNVSRLQHFKNIPFVKDENEQKGEIKFFYFFYDLFIRDLEDQFNEIFSNLKNEDLLSDILKISNEMQNAALPDRKYKILFPKLRKQFLEDVKVMAKNPTFFNQNLADLAMHYTFIVMSQIVIQTNKFTLAEYNQLHKLVFVNMSERELKRRDFYNQGMKFLQEEVKEFFVHEHILNILGFNSFASETNWFYKDYATYFEGKDKECNEFIASIYNWINNHYTVYYPATEKISYNNQTLQQAFKDLYNVLNKNVKEELYSRYSLAFETLAKRFYRKPGGSLGNILGIPHQRLMMLIAVAVGPRGNQLELNKLWIELENRGVFFDRMSKEEVVKILDNLNYLDKKSDSGDAQYVKSIL